MTLSIGMSPKELLDVYTVRENLQNELLAY